MNSVQTNKLNDPIIIYYVRAFSASFVILIGLVFVKNIYFDLYNTILTININSVILVISLSAIYFGFTYKWKLIYPSTIVYLIYLLFMSAYNLIAFVLEIRSIEPLLENGVSYFISRYSGEFILSLIALFYLVKPNTRHYFKYGSEG